MSGVNLVPKSLKVDTKQITLSSDQRSEAIVGSLKSLQVDTKHKLPCTPSSNRRSVAHLQLFAGPKLVRND